MLTHFCNTGKSKAKLGLPVTLIYLADNKELNQEKSAVGKLEADEKRLLGIVEVTGSQAQELKDANQSANEELSGGSGSVIAQLKSIKQNLSQGLVEAKVSAFIDDIFKLLVLFILQAILIPLFFFYLFTRLAKKVWTKDWGGIIADKINAL
jgi:hypothetical protein